VTSYSATIVPGAPLAADHRQRVLTVTRLHIRCRRTLDPEPLIARLASDVKYESQEHQDPIRGRDALAEYLRERYEFLRDIAATRDMGEWRLGEVDLPAAASHPCAIFLLGGKAAALHVIGATDEGLIGRIEILTIVPRPDQARPIDDDDPDDWTDGRIQQ
jgi:hypothetical protein